MDLSTALILYFAAASLLMAALWGYQLKSRDAGIVDVGWAAILGSGAIFFAVLLDGDPTRRIIVGILGGVWGFRLAYYLLRDRIIGKEEDGRYSALRSHWGKSANLKFFFFFQFQAVLDLVLAASFIAVAVNPAPFGTFWDYAALVIWLVSVAGESVADAQLSRFRGNPENKGKTCRDGLWRYSRHPNYFFEWIHWFTYISLAVGSPYFWLSFVAPVLMYIFVTRISGIPFTEIQAVKSRGDDYRQYQKTTNAFFPWIPSGEAG